MLLNFAWKCFSSTGSIEAYLLYKELKDVMNKNSDKAEAGTDVSMSSDAFQELSEGV